ncbi:hypothetical protein ACFY9F_11335 [Streptomyces sp. NPDC012421]
MDGEIDGVMALDVDADARIGGLYYVRSPLKLSRVTTPTPLALC